MTTVRLGTRVPARWRLFVCGLALLASGLVAASAGGWMPHLSQLSSSALTPDRDAELPAPTQYSYRATHSTTMSGVKPPLRIEIEVRLSAKLSDVLAFYRSELGKLGWQEQGDGALIAADRVQLAFASPVGPAVLKLGRKDDSTTVSLVQRNQGAATKANVMPVPGQAKLVFCNIGEKEAVLAINEQTIKQTADDHAVSLDLAPGRYSYALSVPGHPTSTNILTVAAGDAWELTVGRDGDAWSPLQLY